MSPQLADSVSYWANWALLAALAVGVVASALIWRTGLVKDLEFARYKTEAEARVADANRAGLDAGQKAAAAAVAAAEANKRAAEANERAEELKGSNLTLQRDLLELQKSVKGREISDEQQRLIVAGARNLKLPDLVVYYNEKDPEAQIYAVSIVSVLQDLGMKGRVGFLSNNPPQVGVAYVGTGTAEEGLFIEILMKAKVLTIAANGDAGFPDLTPERAFGAPKGSIVVGLKPPQSTFRVSESGRKH